MSRFSYESGRLSRQYFLDRLIRTMLTVLGLRSGSVSHTNTYNSGLIICKSQIMLTITRVQLHWCGNCLWLAPECVISLFNGGHGTAINAWYLWWAKSMDKWGAKYCWLSHFYVCSSSHLLASSSLWLDLVRLSHASLLPAYMSCLWVDFIAFVLMVNQKSQKHQCLSCSGGKVSTLS